MTPGEIAHPEIMYHDANGRPLIGPCHVPGCDGMSLPGGGDAHSDGHLRLWCVDDRHGAPCPYPCVQCREDCRDVFVSAATAVQAARLAGWTESYIESVPALRVAMED